MHQRLLPKPQPPPKRDGQALRMQCQKELDRGPLTTPKLPLAVYCPLRNHCLLQNQGANHFWCNKHCFASIAYAVQRTAGSGTTDHPETTDHAAARTPDTHREQQSLRHCGPLRNGGAVTTSALHLWLCNHAICTPFLPHFYPLKGKMPRFYPIFPPFLPRCIYQFLHLRVKVG